MADPGISGAGSGMEETKRGHWLLKLFYSCLFLPQLSYIPFLGSEGKGEQVLNENRVKRNFSALYRRQGQWHKTDHCFTQHHHQCGC